MSLRQFERTLERRDLAAQQALPAHAGANRTRSVRHFVANRRRTVRDFSAGSTGAGGEGRPQSIVGGRPGEELGVRVIQGITGRPVDENRIDVEAGRSIHEANVDLVRRKVLLAPGVEGDQDGAEIVAGLGQDVLVTWRALAVASALEQARLHERVEPAGQRIRRDAQAPLEVLEPGDAMSRVAQDQDAPPLPDALECQRDWTAHAFEARAFHDGIIRDRQRFSGL